MLSHMFVPILTVVFHNWLPQGSVRFRITLLKKEKHGGNDLDDYRPIYLLNT